MDPVSMGLAIAATTAVVGAASAGIQGMQASGQAKTQADAARYEASIAQQQAKTDLQIGASQEGAQRLQNVQVEGEQQAVLAQRNIGVTSGSAQDVMRSTAIENELSALNIRYQGQLNAHGEQIYAQEAGTAANIFDSNAQNALTNGYLGAGTALLSATNSYANSNWPKPSWFPQPGHL
jgi:hypothetical protein